MSALGFRCIRLFLSWHLVAPEKAQVTLLVLRAVADHGDNLAPRRALFPLEACGTWQTGRVAPDINPRGAGPPTGTAWLCWNLGCRPNPGGPSGLPGGWHFLFLFKMLQLSTSSPPPLPTVSPPTSQSSLIPQVGPLGPLVSSSRRELTFNKALCARPCAMHSPHENPLIQGLSPPFDRQGNRIKERLHSFPKTTQVIRGRGRAGAKL